MKPPLDATPYPQDPRSKPLDGNTPDGTYVYVQDVAGAIYVVLDGPHLHPKVLGNAQSALYAGDLTIENGVATEVTNLSGTFQCDDEAGLLSVVHELRRIGFQVEKDAARFFPPDGSRPFVMPIDDEDEACP